MRPKPPQGLVQSGGLCQWLREKLSPLLVFLLQRFNFVQFSVNALLILFYMWVLSTSRLDRFENIFLDYFFRIRPTPVIDSSIAFIEISNDSIKAIGRWPWPRHYHAVMTHLLTEWGARAIVFDVIFSEESTPFDDNALEEAFQKTRSLYLPVIYETTKEEKGNWVHSLPRFERSAKGTGHINIDQDKDGTLRRIRPFLDREGERHPHLALRVAWDQLGEETSLPLGERGNLLINWTGSWERTFEHYSYVDLIKSFEALKKGRAPLIDPAKIKDKICLIGLTATGHADIKASPVQGSYPAVGVHANVINSLLTRQFIRPATLMAKQIVLFLVGCLALLCVTPFRNVLSLTAAFLLACGWFFTAFLFFWRQGIWLCVLQPFFLIFSLLIFSAVYAQVIANKEKLQLFFLASRDGLTGLYVIRYFRTLIHQAVGEAKVSGKPLSVILMDIDNFKKINDTYGHQAGDHVLKSTAGHVNACIRSKRDEKISDCVARYGGEEFIVMLRDSNLTDAAFTVAERIRQTVEGAVYEWEGKRIPVTLSLGVATFRPGESAPDPMIQRADQGLYRAKHEGKNRVCIEK